MKNFSIKPDTLNLIEENIQNSSEHTGTGDDFLKRPIINNRTSRNFKVMSGKEHCR